MINGWLMGNHPLINHPLINHPLIIQNTLNWALGKLHTYFFGRSRSPFASSRPGQRYFIFVVWPVVPWGRGRMDGGKRISKNMSLDQFGSTCHVQMENESARNHRSGWPGWHRITVWKQVFFGHFTQNVCVLNPSKNISHHWGSSSAVDEHPAADLKSIYNHCRLKPEIIQVQCIYICSIIQYNHVRSHIFWFYQPPTSQLMCNRIVQARSDSVSPPFVGLRCN
jgi:hypothetical protein